jgi:DNA-binding MarR family transcriptional regulator
VDDVQHDPPAALRRLPTWLLAQASARGHRHVDEVLAAEGLRRHHFSVLLCLEDGEPASQAELCRRLSKDRSDMAAAVAQLEGARLVSRARDDGDRRRKDVRLTPDGRRAIARLSRQVQAAQDALLEPLTAAEREQFAALLERVIATR